MQGDRDVISDRPVGSVLVVVPTPSLQFFLCVRKAHEPVRVQAFPPELAVECEEDQKTVWGTIFPTQDEAIVGGLARA